MTYLSTDERLKIANAVDVDSLDDAQFLAEATKLLDLWGGSYRKQRIVHQVVGRTAGGHRAAISILRYNDGTRGDSLALDIKTWEPSYREEKCSWHTTGNASSVIFGRGNDRCHLGFRYEHEYNTTRDACHVTGAYVHMDAPDGTADFWRTGNVELMGQAIAAMSAALVEYNPGMAQEARAWQIAQFEATLTPLVPTPA